MIKQGFILFVALFGLILGGCGGDLINKPNALFAVESHTKGGLQAYAEGSWSKSKRLFKQALSFYQGIDDQANVLLLHINLAEVALAEHDYPSSQKYLDTAANIAKKELLQYYQKRIALLYALIALQQKQITIAESILQPILPEFDGVIAVTSMDSTILAVIASRTKVAFSQKQDELLWTHRFASALDSSVNKSNIMEARLLRFQANLLLRQESYDESELKLQQALSLYKKDLFRAGIAMTLLELGQLYSKKHYWQDAMEYLNRSRTVFRFLKNISKVNLITQRLVEMKSKKLAHGL